MAFGAISTQILELIIVLIVELWWNIALWERILRHQKNWRIWNPPNLIDSLFTLLICISNNTLVFYFSNGHFWPTLFLFLTNNPSLTPLIHCSFSLSLLPSPLLPTPVSPLEIWYKYPLVLWDGIIEINWLKVNGCFT